MKKAKFFLRLVCGALAGFLFVFAIEAFALVGRHWVLSYWIQSPTDLGLLLLSSEFWAVSRIIFIGIFAGIIIGQALNEWLAGNVSRAREICRHEARAVIRLTILLSVLPVLFALQFYPFKTSWRLVVIEMIFDSFPLQISLFLLMLMRWLPDSSRKTVQITENLRL